MVITSYEYTRHNAKNCRFFINSSYTANWLTLTMYIQTHGQKKR